jgi:hypothetical protein
MNVRKTLARAVALALLAAPLTVAAAGVGPAQAATTLQTTALIQVANAVPLDYGTGTGRIEAAIKGSDGYAVTTGTVHLQALAYGAAGWADVTTTTASGYLSFDVKPSISTQYRVVYDGGSDSSYTYAGTTSAPVDEPVARVLKVKYKGLKMWGTVKPASKLKLVFKIKKGKKYKNWFKVKTNKKGKWTKHIKGKVGTKFAVVVPAGGGYAATGGLYKIRRTYF